MLNQNLKTLRNSKGISQEELAIKLNVVRQTVSKWEQGLSVPDSEMLIKIATELDTSVNVLLGEEVPADEQNELKAIAAKLELVNTQLAQKNENRRKILRTIFIIVGAIAVVALLYELVSFIRFGYLFNELPENVSTVGGYDAPTEIFISGISINPTLLVGTVVAAVVSIIGLFATKRK